MSIPEITHLQFLVLHELIDGFEVKGRSLRSKLEGRGHKKSAPAFYQFMSRLEDGKLIEGRYEQKIVEGQIIKERAYKITGHGVRAWEEISEFYGPLISKRSHGLSPSGSA